MIALFASLSLYCSNANNGNDKLIRGCQDSMMICVKDNWAARSRKGYLEADETGKIYIDCVADWKRK